MKIVFSWFPCTVLFKTVRAAAVKYPNLTFKIKYFEGGMGFCGKFVVKGSDVLEDTQNNAYRGRRGG